MRMQMASLPLSRPNSGVRNLDAVLGEYLVCLTVYARRSYHMESPSPECASSGSWPSTTVPVNNFNGPQIPRQDHINPKLEIVSGA